MDDRIERLLEKAEEAIDRNDTDQADAYRILAGNVAYLRRQEAKALERLVAYEPPGDTIIRVLIDPDKIEESRVETEDE